MLKLKMMLCVMMLPLVVVVLHKAVCQSVREATTASSVNVPSTGVNAAGGIIASERADPPARQLEGTHYINEQCR